MCHPLPVQLFRAALVGHTHTSRVDELAESINLRARPHGLMIQPHTRHGDAREEAREVQKRCTRHQLEHVDPPLDLPAILRKIDACEVPLDLVLFQDVGEEPVGELGDVARTECT